MALSKEEKRIRQCAASKRYREKNHEKVKAYLRDYHKKRRIVDPEYCEAVNERCRRWYINNLEHARESAVIRQRKYTYGVTEDQFVTMLNAQDNKCKICLGEFIETPQIDHNHTTEVVRGLLCRKCNWGLGVFSDDINRLLSAVAYLREADGR